MGWTRPVLAPAVLLALAAPAAAGPTTARLTVQHALNADCAATPRTAAGTASVAFTARTGGYLTARLRAAGGDWDLAVIRGNGGVAAASAYRGAREVASGFVRRGERLTLRTCRRSGAVRTARVRIAVSRSDGLRRRVIAVRVPTPTAVARERLERLGFDVAEHGASAQATVLLHGGRDLRRLRASGLAFRRVVDRPARAAVRVRAAALPSGRTLTYRQLEAYSLEMKALAAANQDIVKPITLPHLSRRGHPVEGLEITTNPNARDGKPVYLQLGMHHAREWPSAEHTLEWAYELVNGYRAGDLRTRSLVERVRTIVVPIVNPDGFDFSRDAGEAALHGGGHNGFTSGSAEYHRKNCPSSGCAVSAGVDLNRNYGDLWGGPGTSTVEASDNYLGPAPFSEPETQNIRALISSRHVVVVITNHTFANEILRQPGINTEPVTPDESVYGGLGAEMAAENGYDNFFSWQNGGGLNNHVGTTDGWGYYVTGGLGYVVEIGPSFFHPLYANMVAEYDGSGVPGGGNREAYYVAMEAAANRALHAVLTGSAPPGAVLRLAKSFRNRTFTDSIPEHLESTMVVPDSGQFEWHVNQSGRPLVPAETWTLTCEQPEGTVVRSQQVAVARGQELDLAGNACPAVVGEQPPPGDPGRAAVTLNFKLVAGVRGLVYRARVSGALRNVGDFERCDGAVAVSLNVRRTRLARKRAGLDERCRFSRVLTFRLRDLPKPIRRLGARPRLRAAATWAGNDSLGPATKSASARVVRRRR
jgi:murein tripeptide amidase MpaA